MNACLKISQKLWPTAVFEPATSGFPTAMTPHTCIRQDGINSADLSSARHGQFEEKEKGRNFDYELKIFLSKNFLRKKTRNNKNRDEIAEKAAGEFLVQCWSSGPVIDRKYLEPETTKKPKLQLAHDS